jgi:hypothetical protein
MLHIGRNIILLFVVFNIFLGCRNKNSKIADNKKSVSSDSSNSAVTKANTSTNNKTSTDKKQPTKNSVEQKVNENYADFSVLSFTSQDWHGGIKGSGGGTNYEITAVTNQSSVNLIFDQLWIGQKFYEITVIKKFPAVTADGFSANDTIYIHASDYRKDPDFNRNIQVTDSETKKIIKTAEATNINPPYVYKGVALIGYKLNGQRVYKIIESIIKKPPLFYP